MNYKIKAVVYVTQHCSTVGNLHMQKCWEKRHRAAMNNGKEVTHKQ